MMIKNAYITEEDIRAIEDQVDHVKRETRGVNWCGSTPEITLLVEKLVKEVRRLQARVEWLEKGRPTLGAREIRDGMEDRYGKDIR